MLDRTCNLFLALGNPEQTDLYAEYSQWKQPQKNGLHKRKRSKKRSSNTRSKTKSSLSYNEKKELDGIVDKISKLEEELKELNHLMDTAQIASNPKKLDEVCKAAVF